MGALCCALGTAMLWVGFVASPAEAQQVLARQTCVGSLGGVELSGTLVLERWSHARTFRYYGAFRDPAGNVYELEVFTGNLEGGVGGTWLNGMRHRETHINLRVFEGGFVVQTEDGIVVQYKCGTG